eukprot:57809-Prorocentrum_minimum.AAC.1
MPVGTRANPQLEEAPPMANPQPELPVTAIQKAYDRMIDTPTVVSNSNAPTTAAINLININTICVAWIKLYGQFSGDGTSMSKNKFVCKFTELIQSAFKNIATINSEAIFKEHKAPTTSYTIDEDANQLIFDILSTIYEDTAYSLISPYFKADDEDANDRDGRRAFFALLREFFPRTTNSAGDAGDAEMQEMQEMQRGSFAASS